MDRCGIKTRRVSGHSAVEDKILHTSNAQEDEST